MNLEFKATYRDGAVHPETPINLPENTPVHVHLEGRHRGRGEAALFAHASLPVMRQFRA